jgi:hypothetical protein
MKKTLALSAALVLTAAGCKMMEPRPDPSGGQCTAPGGMAPRLPPLQRIPDTAPPPSLPSAQFIVVGTCEPTGTYVATGVNTRDGRFTFLIKGTAATRSAAFARFYAAGVPVTVYTSPVRLTAGAGTPASSPTEPPPPPPPGPTPTPTPGDDPGDGGIIFRPCDQIGDDPKEPDVPTGAPPYDPLENFKILSWRTASSLDAITDQIGASTVPIPVPR